MSGSQFMKQHLPERNPKEPYDVFPADTWFRSPFYPGIRPNTPHLPLYITVYLFSRIILNIAHTFHIQKVQQKRISTRSATELHAQNSPRAPHTLVRQYPLH